MLEPMNLREELEKLRIDHYRDYEGLDACPQSVGSKVFPCDCGADEHNERIDKIIKHLKVEDKNLSGQEGPGRIMVWVDDTRSI